MPVLAGVCGGLLASWCTFVPCFLWIGLGAPFIEKLRDNKPLSGALAGITAAVVGVILNLAIWFALHTWFREAWQFRGLGFSFDIPVSGTFEPWTILLSVPAMIAIFRFNAGMIPTLLACSATGVVLHLAGVVRVPTMKRFREAQSPRGPIQHAQRWVVSRRPKY